MTTVSQQYWLIIVYVLKQNTRSNLHMSQQEKSPLWIQSPEETSRVWIHGSRFSVPVSYYTQLKHTHRHTHTHTHTHTHIFLSNQYNHIISPIIQTKNIIFVSIVFYFILTLIQKMDDISLDSKFQITIYRINKQGYSASNYINLGTFHYVLNLARISRFDDMQ